MFPAKADTNTVLAVLSLCPEGMRVDTIGLRDGWAPKFYWISYSLLFSTRKACQKAAGHQGVWYWCFHLQLLLMPTGPSERLWDPVQTLVPTLDLQVQTGFWTTLSNGDAKAQRGKKRGVEDISVWQKALMSEDQCIFKFRGAVNWFQLILHWWWGGWLLSDIPLWTCSLRPCIASLRTQINWWFHCSWKWVGGKKV